MKGHLDAGQLKSMDYKSLQALAKDMGVSAAGKAEDIIARIAAVEADAPESGIAEKEKAIFDEGKQEWEEAGAKARIVMVKAIARFLDKQLKQIKDVDEEYGVSWERAAQLEEAGVAEIIG